MGKQQTTIEINGKRYDARTGSLIGENHPQHKANPVKTAAKPVLDVLHKPSPAKQVHRTTERSKTLMRHVVKKPAAPAAPKAKPASARTLSDIAAPVKKTPLALTSLHHQYDTQREARAQKIKQSKLVSKFSDFTSQPSVARHDEAVPQRIEPMSVRPAPAHAHPAVISSPLQHRSPAHSVLDKGLRAAQSHTEAPKKVPKKHHSRRSRLASLGAGSLAVLLLGAFITYQNAPNLAMRYAAARSGVSASLPDYRPSGFSLNNRIQYNPGQITVNFKSNTDERNFTITQRESNWNSDTLMSNYVAANDTSVQTYEDKGRTIYLYGDSNATWVNGGVWYDINGNSQLTSDQLIRIATSM